MLNFPAGSTIGESSDTMERKEEDELLKLEVYERNSTKLELDLLRKGHSFTETNEENF
jgi:hypothetical protein